MPTKAATRTKADPEPETKTAPETDANGAARKRYEMTAEHKESLAEGREQGRIIREYLTMLDVQQRGGRRGRPRNTDKMRTRASELPGLIDMTRDRLKRLHLIQELHNLQAELVTAEGEISDEAFAEAEAAFIKVAAKYAKSKGLSYTAFRLNGVPAPTLKAAGMSRATHG